MMPFEAVGDSVTRSRGKPKGSMPDVASRLSPEFFVRMKAKGHRPAMADYRWVFDNEFEYRSMLGRWDGKDGRQWDEIVEFLEGAPGLGSITLLEHMAADPKATLLKVIGELNKGDGEDEDRRRGRALRNRFDVIGKLLDVGRPVPLWLDEAEGWAVREGV